MITAITLWFVTGGLVIVYVGWALSATAAGASPWWFVMGAPLAYAAVIMTFTTAWFALAWIFRARRPPDARLGPAATARLVWNEFRAIARSGPRMALYRWTARDPAPAPAVAPILLVHGVLCNAGVWYSMRKDLAARGFGPVYTLSYGPPLASIDSFAEQVAERIESILRETGAHRVAIVGHSMGGIVARAYLRRHGPARLSVVMTLGAPHHGSAHAWLFPGICLGQLRPGNAWLAALNRDEDASNSVRVVSLWSWHDSMVAPQTSAHLSGAENIELVGIGHNALLGNGDVRELVLAGLARAAREAGRG